MTRHLTKAPSGRAVGLAVAALCLTMTACGSSDGTPAQAAKTDDPADDPVVTSVPSGAWTLAETTVAAEGAPDFKPGAKSDPTTWTFTPECTSAAECGGQVRSSSGRTFSFTWDGTTLTVVRSGSLRSVHTTPCVDDAGKEAPGTTYKLVQLLDREVSLAADAPSEGSVPRAPDRDRALPVAPVHHRTLPAGRQGAWIGDGLLGADARVLTPTVGR